MFSRRMGIQLALAAFLSLAGFSWLGNAFDPPEVFSVVSVLAADTDGDPDEFSNPTYEDEGGDDDTGDQPPPDTDQDDHDHDHTTIWDKLAQLFLRFFGNKE